MITLKNSFLSIAITSVLLLAGCQESSAPENPSNESQTPTQETVEDGLHLVGDKKWKVPPGMMENIDEQMELVIFYDETSDTLHQELGQKLDDLCKTLVQECTMTGEAHNVLHEWLIPYWETIDSLKEVKDMDQGDKLINDLYVHYATFEDYFE
ncbi:hypothetical protein [Parvicella tangerina]|uniref:Uncharacterized protein n=1 Tax=Parvicella tangerina TaxID=2829795 RepID=A0A916JMY5_9FLAO|nr:hypothetical protein [Parvicella tangerina]CAG5082932.1 hypothetical protein CRYO30217_02046 [Parvicella tangerina]